MLLTLAVSGMTLTYDRNGNLMSDGTLSYTWNRAEILGELRYRLIATNNGSYNTHYAYDGQTISAVGRWAGW